MPGRNAALDYSAGCVIINLDKWRTLLLQADNNHFEPLVVDIQVALKWMLQTPGVFGLIVRMQGGVVVCELFAMVFFLEHGDAHIGSRARRIVSIVESWS